MFPANGPMLGVWGLEPLDGSMYHRAAIRLHNP